MLYYTRLIQAILLQWFSLMLFVKLLPSLLASSIPLWRNFLKGRVLILLLIMFWSLFIFSSLFLSKLPNSGPDIVIDVSVCNDFVTREQDSRSNEDCWWHMFWITWHSIQIIFLQDHDLIFFLYHSFQRGRFQLFDFCSKPQLSKVEIFVLQQKISSCFVERSRNLLVITKHASSDSFFGLYICM